MARQVIWPPTRGGWSDRLCVQVEETRRASGRTVTCVYVNGRPVGYLISVLRDNGARYGWDWSITEAGAELVRAPGPFRDRPSAITDLLTTRTRTAAKDSTDVA